MTAYTWNQHIFANLNVLLARRRFRRSLKRLMRRALTAFDEATRC
jgi:hypothetical protein